VGDVKFFRQVVLLEGANKSHSSHCTEFRLRFEDTDPLLLATDRLWVDTDHLAIDAVPLLQACDPPV